MAPPTSGTVRRHDLDALRGFAMVLGIALHASLSFFPNFWPAQDSTASYSGWFDEFFHAIHGFRMPLFFLLSGYFTSMLRRRRGLRSLLVHRLKRIALPLAVGMVTIVPAVNWSAGVAIDAAITDYVEASDDIWAAVFFRNGPAVEGLIERGVDIDEYDAEGSTPLHVAALVDDAVIANLLLEAGADPDPRGPEGTPIEYAVFFGHEDVARALVDGGAPDPRPAGGDWDEISYWATGAGIDEALTEDLGLSTWLVSFHHLWFLWFLLWLVAGFAVVVTLGDRIGSGAPRSPRSRWIWWLIPLTLLPQVVMGDGGTTPVFGPDTSTGLIPIPHVLLYYAVFFTFGAVAFGRVDRRGAPLIDAVGKWWKAALPIGILVVFPLALVLTFPEQGEAPWGMASIAQVAYVWLMIGGLMGAFRAFLASERRGVRYLSDSSYWLYLAHVPIVILAQSAIRHWDINPSLKFLGLTAVVTTVLLVTYQLFVRYSPLGTMLNGRRVRPGGLRERLRRS